jgi:hypothetical protein
MSKRFIESAEQKLLRERDQVVRQLEGARREISLVKKWLDAPCEDPYWEFWATNERGELARIQRELSEIQIRIRDLTLTFVGNSKVKEEQ